MSQVAQCHAAYGRHLAETRGRRASEWEGMVMCDAGLSNYRNMVVPLHPIAERTSAHMADRLIDFFGSPIGWIIWSVFSSDLSASGFVQPSFTGAVMTRASGRPEAVVVPAELAIEEVITDDGVGTFERVRGVASTLATRSYGDAPRLDVRALSSWHRMWLGRVAGEPVATVASFESNGLNMIKDVSTLPAFCRRGIGTAMSLHAIGASDCPAVLDANPGTDLLYRRLGFLDRGVLRFWRLAE